MKKITYSIEQFEPEPSPFSEMYYIWFNTSKGEKKNWLGISLDDFLTFSQLDEYDYYSLVINYNCSIITHVLPDTSAIVSFLFERKEDAENLAKVIIRRYDEFILEDWKALNEFIKNMEL